MSTINLTALEDKISANELTHQQIRRKIKKATSDLCDLSESRVIQADYWDAIKTLNMSKLKCYWSLGRTTRHQVMNVNDYIHGLTFGFKEILFDEYGWLENDNWKAIEQIEIRLKEDNACCNRITLACGANDIWAFGLSYQFGTSGGGSAPCVYANPYKSRQDCLKAALNELTKKMEDCITHASTHPDPINYKVPYMRKIIQKIAKDFAEPTQLQLF